MKRLPFWGKAYQIGRKRGFDEGWDKGWDSREASIVKWEGFTPTELDELSICLDHRMGEAKAGNAYVYTDVVKGLLEDLYGHHPGLNPDATSTN